MEKILVLMLALGIAMLTACSGDDTNATEVGESEAVVENEATEPEDVNSGQEGLGRSEVFGYNLEWAIGRVDFVYDQINEPLILADSFTMILSFLSVAQGSITDSLPTPDQEINHPMRHLEAQIEFTLIPAIEDAQGLVDSGNYEAEYVMEVIADVFNPVLISIREELEALQ